VRKIHGFAIGYNVRRRGPAVLALAGAVLAAGCGRPGTTEDRATAEYRAEGCAAVVSLRGVRDFYALADRAAETAAIALPAGDHDALDAVLGDLNALASGGVYDRWRRSYLPQVLRPEQIGRNMFIAMVGREGLPDRLQAKTARTDLVLNYRQTLDRRREITDFLESLGREDGVCAVFARLRDWVPREALPETLRCEFLVTQPEIRFVDGTFFIDASLAWAKGRGQLTDALASTLYKQTRHLDGPHPGQAHGADILLHSLRIVVNEAVGAYLNRSLEIAYDPRHERLANASARPDDLAGSAYRTLEALDRHLTRVLALPEPGDDDWTMLYRLFVGAQSWHTTGWLMARTIVDQLGEKRLREAAGTVPGFFAAYHEACAKRPTGTDAPPDTAAWFVANAPCFSEANQTWLDRELRRLFPAPEAAARGRTSDQSSG
jgi:hypothetical protein